MINRTGKIATTTIDVKEDAALETLTIVPPTEVVAANDGTVKLDYVTDREVSMAGGGHVQITVSYRRDTNERRKKVPV